jgi:hypothetical protein
MGRRKGTRNSAPIKGSHAEKLVQEYDKEPRHWRDLAQVVGCTDSHAITVLNKWRPEWREIF